MAAPEAGGAAEMPAAGDGDECAGAEMPMPTFDHGAARKKPSQLVTTIGGLIGNILEWYDFAVYGALAENIGAAFFPTDCADDTGLNGTATEAPGSGSVEGSSCADGNLIESFAVFGGAFLMRPLGALIFGHIGDKRGRKRALELSVQLMCVSTVAMGCLPTYAQAGAAAPVLLCLVRLCQGVSVGGELIGSIVYTTETAPADRWGLYGCLALMTAVLGTTLGMAVGAAMHGSMSDEVLNDWGWRVPFLLGIVLGFFAIWLRTNMTDSQEFLQLLAEGKISKNPLKDAVTTHFNSTMIVFFVVLVWANGFYTVFIWIRVYMDNLIESPVAAAHGIVAGGMVVLCLVFPPLGYVSDLVASRRGVMLAGGVMMTICCVPFFLVVNDNGSTGVVFLCLVLYAVLLAAWGSPMCAWMVEAFPVQARYSAVAIGYNTAHALTGAAPLLCTYLTTDVSLMAPGYYLLFVNVGGTLALFLSPRILGQSHGSGSAYAAKGDAAEPAGEHEGKPEPALETSTA